MPSTLTFPEAYPVGRSAFFAVRFIAHCLRRGIAYTLGQDAMLLLVAIVTAEDRVRYTKPVNFWNDQLVGQIGLTARRLYTARDLCVTRGWLSHFEGSPGKPPQYFVKVPGGDQAIDAAPIDDRELEGFAEVPAPVAIQPKPTTSQVALSPAMADLIDRLKACGVRAAASTLSNALALIDADHLAAVVAYHHSRRITTPDGDLFPYSAALLVERLTNKAYAALPPAEGWSEKLIDPDWKTAHRKQADQQRRERERRERAEQAEQQKQQRQGDRQRLQQLELAFGPVIDALSTQSPDRLWQAVREFSADLEAWGRKNASGLRSPLIRRKLLELAEAGKIATGV